MLLAVLAMLLLAMATLPHVSYAQAPAPRKKVLILNSYSPGYKWTDDIVRGISDAARQTGANVSLHMEFMDTKLAADAEYFRLLYQTYRYKFRNIDFDAIIASDNDAFDFLLKQRDRLFPSTPVIFCGVNQFEPSQLGGASKFTGVNEEPDFRATIDLALKLHPRTRQILVINDLSTTGRRVHQRIAELLPLYHDRLKFSFLEDAEMHKVLEAVEKLPRDSLILYTFFFRDKAGRIFDFDESISLITQRSMVPIYGFWDFSLGYGIVGGMLTSGYDQGKTAGSMAMRVLNGESAQNIPVVMGNTNRYMFDYLQLQRFGIDLSSLPQGSLVINRPGAKYTLQRSTIFMTVAILTSMMLVIILMLHNMSIKKLAQQDLRRFADEMEQRVKERTEELEQSWGTLELQNRKLRETYRGLQRETADRIRVMEELRQRDQLLIQQSRMAAMGEMLTNLAHQWRQPLNVLGLRIQEIGMSYRLGGFSKELLEENVAKAMEILRHISSTIDEFRTFSTPDRQKVTFRLNEVIEKTVALLGEAMRDQGISLETAFEGDPVIDGYPHEYAQVLLNILMNAKDAFLERQVAVPRIVLRSWSENGRTEVTITDNAGGIDESIMEKIFDPYFTTKELGKGTGVGLFMAKQIIEGNMGGRLAARNTGDGVEFRITL